MWFSMAAQLVVVAAQRPPRFEFPDFQPKRAKTSQNGRPGQTGKNSQLTFWQGHCTLVKRTWGRARYPMNVRYFAHHVVQYGRPAHPGWRTATPTMRVTSILAQNGSKWPFWVPKSSILSNWEPKYSQLRLHEYLHRTNLCIFR